MTASIFLFLLGKLSFDLFKKVEDMITHKLAGDSVQFSTNNLSSTTISSSLRRNKFSLFDLLIEGHCL